MNFRQIDLFTFFQYLRNIVSGFSGVKCIVRDNHVIAYTQIITVFFPKKSKGQIYGSITFVFIFLGIN